MAESNGKNNLLWGSILIFIGLLFLLNNFNIMDFGDFFSTFWPVILILVGLKIILDKRRAGSGARMDTQPEMNNGVQKTIGTLSESNVFGDIKIISDSQKFTGGSVNNVFGDIRVDISKVQLENAQAKLYVSGIFGDLTVILPERIAYRVKASAVAGDLMVFGNKREGIFPSLEHSSENYNTATKRLFLQTSIVFGSVNILFE